MSPDASGVLLYGKAYRMGFADVIAIPKYDNETQQIVTWG